MRIVFCSQQVLCYLLKGETNRERKKPSSNDLIVLDSMKFYIFSLKFWTNAKAQFLLCQL